MDCRDNDRSNINMAAIDFYKLSDSDKRAIFTTASERKGLPAYAIKKRLVGSTNATNRF